ncbi:MAG: nucleoside phosphorylase [Bacteroidales bacterium]|nr:nucleoside phosphorylase [Bacteroidales bacterium]MDD7608143.1 nucleoside phosphorylase [Bacteroidales bacterium]MDY5459012.1 nucleoside phosphorylase [Candidatus Cryptobacteroides sp.]MEE0340034.1 nucleoside phosphorylase [Bacteroidales bacterium]
MRIAESELIINSDGSIFHLHIRPEQLARNVILVGDPGRVAMFKPYFQTLECEGASREFVWATGVYNNSRITVLSTGIGTDNIDIVMTELDALANIDFATREVKPEHTTLNVVRLGTCGALQPEIPLGAFILSHISIGFDGLMNWYANREEVTNVDMEQAFMKHMNWPKDLPTPYFVSASQKLIDLFADSTVRGMTISSPGFYGPQGRVVRQGLAMPNMLEDIESFRYEDRKITNFEMEGSAIAGIAGHLGHEAITVCCAIAHRYLKDANTDYKPRVAQLVKLVLDKISTI